MAQGYAWSQEDRQIITEYKEWLKSEWDRVESLEKFGPTDEPWPKRPKGVKSLYPRFCETRDSLTGQRLHDYLVARRVDHRRMCLIDNPPQGRLSLENFKTPLQRGWRTLKHRDGSSLYCYLLFGQWLNQAFAQFMIEENSGTWKEWLAQSVGISEAEGRKIREIERLLRDYPGFKKLGLPFSEVYKLRKQIGALLEANGQPWADYWRQA